MKYLTLLFCILMLNSVISIIFSEARLNRGQNWTHKHGTTKYKNSEPCKRNFKKGRIANGYDAQIGQFPPFVSLKISTRDGGYNICGGALISNQLVLTAAHCVYNISSILVAPTIVFPADWETEGVEIYSIDRICVSQKHDREEHIWDYAIVRLDRSVKMSDNIQPACLPDKPIDPSIEFNAIGIGYVGYNSVGEAILPTRLKAIPMKQVSCVSGFHSFEHETRLCFKTNRIEYQGSVCPGDSGGPILTPKGPCGYCVVGSASFVENLGHCTPGKPNLSVYTDVYRQLDHVKSLISQCGGL